METTFEQQRNAENEARIVKISAIEQRFKRILKLTGFSPIKQRPTEKGFVYQADLDGEAPGLSEKISLSSGGYSVGFEKVRVSGIYPRDKKGQYITVYEKDANDHWQTVHQDTIKISLGKTDIQISNEIRRRFLPGYVKRLDLVIKKVREDNTYYDLTAQTLRYLKGGELTAWEKENNRATVEGCCCEVSGSDVNIDLRSIPAADAAEILKIVARVNAKKETE